MVYLTLTKQTFKNIQMSIELQENVDIELESTFSFNVTYNDDDTACVAVLKHDLKHKKSPEKFSVSVEGVGQFVCEGIVSDETKKEAHIRAYELLFPYVQREIRDLITEAGMSPLIVPMANMKMEDVQLKGT